VYEFAPVLAGMLEIMLSSQEEKVKADLLSYLKMDTSSLSEENALTELHAKLKTLFELTDEDSSGELDKKEFEACLLDLDVGLKVPEIRVLFAVADTDM
jgi:Ca2+-binding EF-hand superfamily protein